MNKKFYIAQCNISKLKAPLNDPSMKEFMDFLEPVNQLADNMEGFVWRLKGQYGEASSNLGAIFEDEKKIINITVWRNVESLREFTFQTVHSYFLKNRNKWMDSISGVQFAMWWVPEGYIPGIDEAKQKINELEINGPQPGSFTWKQQYDWEGNQIMITV